MLRLLDTARVPPGGVFRYRDAETGQAFEHPYYGQVKARAHEYRSANHLPIPVNWEEYFDDNVCRNTPLAPCADATHPPSLLRQAARLATALTQWAASGFALVPPDVLAQRRAICEGLDGHPRCAHWHRTTGYFGFGRCGVCGCATGLKSGLASEVCPKGYWPK